ncbi:MAG: hypothetical protein ACLU0O_08050 [Collinsella sp.]
MSKIGTSHIGIWAAARTSPVPSPRSSRACAPPATSPLLVLGGEDDFTPFIRDTFAQPAGIDVMLAGVSDDDRVRARDIRVDDEGHPVFTLDFGQGDTVDTMLAIPGVQSVPNAVKAAAVAYRLGVTPEQIDAAFRGLTITGHRQEIKRAKSGHASLTTPIPPVPSLWLPASICCSLICDGSHGDPGRDGRDGRRTPRMHGARGRLCRRQEARHAGVRRQRAGSAHGRCRTYDGYG